MNLILVPFHLLDKWETDFPNKISSTNKYQFLEQLAALIHIILE